MAAGGRPAAAPGHHQPGRGRGQDLPSGGPRVVSALLSCPAPRDPPDRPGSTFREVPMSRYVRAQRWPERSCRPDAPATRSRWPARPARRRVQRRAPAPATGSPSLSGAGRRPFRRAATGPRSCMRPRSASASTASRATPTRAHPQRRGLQRPAQHPGRVPVRPNAVRRPAAACWPGPSSTRCMSRPRRRSWSRPGSARPVQSGARTAERRRSDREHPVHAGPRVRAQRRRGPGRREAEPQLPAGHPRLPAAGRRGDPRVNPVQPGPGRLTCGPDGSPRPGRSWPAGRRRG